MTDALKSDFYEVLPDMTEDAGEATLSASFTPNNGIRVQIQNDDLGPDWAVFDFTKAQAEMVGQALIRWAQRARAEGELIRCGYVVRP